MLGSKHLLCSAERTGGRLMLGLNQPGGQTGQQNLNRKRRKCSHGDDDGDDEGVDNNTDNDKEDDDHDVFYLDTTWESVTAHPTAKLGCSQELYSGREKEG